MFREGAGLCKDSQRCSARRHHFCHGNAPPRAPPSSPVDTGGGGPGGGHGGTGERGEAADGAAAGKRWLYGVGRHTPTACSHATGPHRPTPDQPTTSYPHARTKQDTGCRVKYCRRPLPPVGPRCAVARPNTGRACCWPAPRGSAGALPPLCLPGSHPSPRWGMGTPGATARAPRASAGCGARPRRVGSGATTATTQPTRTAARRHANPAQLGAGGWIGRVRIRGGGAAWAGRLPCTVPGHRVVRRPWCLSACR